MAGEDVRRFWSEVVQNVPESSGPPPAVEASPDSLIQFGSRVHLLEWIDVLARNGNGWSSLPDNLLQASRRQRTRTRFRNGQLLDLMDRVESRAASELDWVWLKGAGFLRQDAHPDGTRRLSDLDLLIPRHQLSRWHRLFDRLGFRPHRNLEWMARPDFSPYVSSTYYVGDHRGQDVTVDLHWHLIDFPARRRAGPWDFSMDPFWGRTQDHLLDASDRFLYQLDHAFTHNFQGWKYLPDLTALQTRSDFSRQTVLSRAKRCHLVHVLALGLDASRRIAGKDWEFPDNLDTGGSPVPATLRRRFVKEAAAGNLEAGAYLKICAFLAGGWLSRLAFLGAVLFPRVDEIPGVGSPPPSPFSRWRLRMRRVLRILGTGGRIWFRT